MCRTTLEWPHGYLHSSVFRLHYLLYCSVVLGVLLYGDELWAIKEQTITKIESFHNQFMRCCIMGASRAE